MQSIDRRTFFPHADGEAFLQPAVATLITLVLVDAAASLEAASVDVFLANGSSEESLTSVAGLCSVMFAGSPVTADGTLRAQASAPAAGRGSSRAVS